MNKTARLRSEWKKILPIPDAYAGRIDPIFSTPLQEFQRRQTLVR